MRDELSKEGQEMWNRISDDDFANQLFEDAKKGKVKTKHENIRTELRKLQRNSHVVITDTTKLMQKFLKNEEYYKATRCEVAILCHTNFIERLQRVLDGKPAFDELVLKEDKVSITDDEFVV